MLLCVGSWISQVHVCMGHDLLSRVLDNGQCLEDVLLERLDECRDALHHLDVVLAGCVVHGRLRLSEHLLGGHTYALVLLLDLEDLGVVDLRGSFCFTQLELCFGELAGRQLPLLLLIASRHQFASEKVLKMREQTGPDHVARHGPLVLEIDDRAAQPAEELD